MEEYNNNNKGRVCVTGGTGFVGSSLVKALLQHGYYVNATIRFDPEGKRDISYLTNLPGAKNRLHIFSADFDRPDTFAAAIAGCIGVFHVAAPLDFENRETEEVKVQRVTNGTRAILQACVDSKTVRRVVYTSTLSTATFNVRFFASAGAPAAVDESSWTDLEFLRTLTTFGEAYIVMKTLTEKLALEFGEKNGLDVVAVLPCWITGPFLSPLCPESIQVTMSLILDDVVRAHIHLFEYPNAKGRYICSAADTNIFELHQFLAATYPQLKLPTAGSLKHFKPFPFPAVSSKKLVETGFVFENGLKEMYDGAIKSCKEIGLL